MQLIRVGFSPRFAALKWAAAILTCGVALGLAVVLPHGAAAWAVPVSLLCAITALRVRPPLGQLRLRREGFCEWIAPGVAPAEMVVRGLFSEAGWLVLQLGRRDGGRARLTLVLAPDAAAPEELRQLRVWLRLAAPRAALNSRSLSWS